MAAFEKILIVMLDVSISPSVKTMFPHCWKSTTNLCPLVCPQLTKSSHCMLLFFGAKGMWTGHVTSAGTILHWPLKFKMHNEQHSQCNKIWETFFTIISASLMYLINKYTCHINSRLWWCNSNYQKLNWVPFFLLENYGSPRIKNTAFTVYKYVTVNYQ
jgi:hypothetical protein